METATTRTDGPTESPAKRGIDGPAERPGVPMEGDAGAAAAGKPAEPTPQQHGRDRHLHRAALDEPTAVFGTGVPPRGVSGVMRKAAYQVPEHYARHWMLLMAADRVDVVESRLGDALADPLDRLGFTTGARYARTNPLAVLAGTLAGAWVVRKAIF